jgi:hypothetical protein
MTMTGHCLCHEVTFTFEGEVSWCVNCHCESCRRNCAAPYTTFIGVPRGNTTMSGTTLSAFQSSPGVRRWFCSQCGSPIAYDAERDATNIHYYTALLTDPLAFQPTHNVHYEERICDTPLADD